jgi:hypothetical protein
MTNSERWVPDARMASRVAALDCKVFRWSMASLYDLVDMLRTFFVVMERERKMEANWTDRCINLEMMRAFAKKRNIFHVIKAPLYAFLFTTAHPTGVNRGDESAHG